MFKARNFLDSTFGTPDRVVAAFGAYGLVSPTLCAVEKWKQRNSVPTNWLVKLLVLAELEAGEPVRLSEFTSWGKNDRTRT